MEILTGLPILITKCGAALVAGELLAMTIKHKRNQKKKEQDKATAELKNYEELNGYLGNDGLLISENIRLKEKFDFENVLLLAPTGVGKTSRYFMNNLLDSEMKGSIIVIDPKGELFEKTSYYQQEICHRKILRFAPLEPSGEQYNLLEQCEDATEVCQLASTLLMNGSLSLELSTGRKANGGIEWLNMAEPLLAAAMLYCRSLPSPYNTIQNALKLIIETQPVKLDLLLSNDLSEDVRTQYNIYRTVAQAANTSASIKVTLASNMKLYTDNKLSLTTNSTTFTAEQLRKEPTALYISYPERKSAYLSPFIAPFITQLIDKMTDCYTYASEPITFLLDEFANIGMINNFQQYVAVSRSRRMSFSVCLQSLSQLNQIYGRENANTILNNLKTKIVLSGLSDSGSLEYFEELAGKTVINTMNENKDKDGNSSFSYSTQVRNVMNKDEIRRLEDRHCLVIMGNRQPVLDYQIPYYEKQELISCIKPPVSQILKLPSINKAISFKDYIEQLYRIKEAEVFKDKEPARDKTKEKIKDAINELFN